MSRSARLTEPTLAGLTCALLLHRRGWRITLPLPPVPHPGALLLRPATADLLASLWGDAVRPVLAAALPTTARHQIWPGADPVTVPKPALCVPAAALLATIARALANETIPTAEAPTWTLATGQTADALLPPLTRLGTRHATIQPVTLHAPLAAPTVAMEGPRWSMLLPGPGRTATLQTIGLGGAHPPAGPIARLIAATGPAPFPLPAMPRARPVPAAGTVIAVGEAALGLDPLCGDGTGHALRGAWAAAQALEAAESGLGPASLEPYAAGLRFALTRHLAACADLYAPCGPAWAEEVTLAASLTPAAPFPTASFPPPPPAARSVPGAQETAA